MNFKLLVYSILLHLLPLVMRLWSLRSDKAAKWIEGRKKWKDKVLEISSKLSKKSFWIHAASLGEYQMALPLIRKFKNQYPDHPVVISFFSPSGYDHVSIPDGCYKFYLPVDYPSNNQFLLDRLNPAMIVFIKYDLWFNLIEQSNKLQIPLILLGFNTSEKKWNSFFYGKLIRSALNHFQLITVLDQDKHSLFKSVINEKNLLSGGDLRYRNVVDQAKIEKKQNILQTFAEKYTKVIVCGSVWSSDMEILSNEINSKTDIAWIIAPHEISGYEYRKICSYLKGGYQLYSELKSGRQLSDHHVLVLDTIGDLFHSYSFADLTYVGGGFESGLHNILEPAAFGKVVFFGPRTDKFPETQFFLKNRMGSIVNSSKDFSEKLIECFNGTQFSSKEKILHHMTSAAEETDFIYKKVFDLLSKDSI